MSATLKLVLGGLVLVMAAACGGSGSGGSGGGNPGPVQHPTSLKGEVGRNDAFEIKVTDESGKTISNLAAGTYTLKVEDLSSIHNFHLTGSGVNDSTTVPDKTEKTFTVTFKKGTYNFICDIHQSQMHGSFTVS